MAKAYSQYVRIRALNLLEQGYSVSQFSRMLSMSRWTLYRWKKQWELNGSTQPIQSVPPPRLSKITDWDKFKNFIDNNQDKTQKKLAQMWGGVSHYTIIRKLKKLGYTRKNITVIKK